MYMYLNLWNGKILIKDVNLLQIQISVLSRVFPAGCSGPKFRYRRTKAFKVHCLLGYGPNEIVSHEQRLAAHTSLRQSTCPSPTW